MAEKQKGLYYGSASLHGGEMKSEFIPEAILNQSGYFQKPILEFERYKQDCRKRALDLAIESAEKFRSDLGREVNDGKTIPKAETIIPIFADKYYNWLISIPQ